MAEDIQNGPLTVRVAPARETPATPATLPRSSWTREGVSAS